MKPISLRQLLHTANKAYGDDLVAMAVKTKKAPGDTLALFLANELKDTFNPEHPIGAAVTALESAITQLDNVIQEIQKRPGA